MSAVVRALSASLAVVGAWAIVGSESGGVFGEQGCFKGKMLRADSLGAGRANHRTRWTWAMEDQGLECGPRLVTKELST